MAFLLLIVEPRGQRATRDETEARHLYEEMMNYAAALQAEGVLLASESLRPDEHAVRLSTSNGTPQLLDGPFTEAREMIGGFFMLDVSSREEAVAIASRCPATRWATVEVRECAPCYIR
ncbi:dehydrogenase [Azoarcus communis]|mgnify:CR=1 FL=1|uniref:Dehydrogenase n=1 Tax=Parazoarcus communis SWub3 = DSM 12120 TaxID=1121029 RepID=A0A323UXQ2_9RHOO|nr:YciI family protein [Parazoarcus communis]NMG47237.1 dehydrogenase [Parazoarcus communis]NMG71778.1 dehydrogenase [Parazoarcus communis SWub3 = DSM 12120]PZA17255.1 dehydrogenase [Azoarcus communis] [Parazoarcus communis SWub3 = DSM 12120]